MICPKCAANGQRSVVSLMSETDDLVHRPQQWDADGKLLDQPQGVSRLYSCSNGHTFTDADIFNARQ